MQNSGTDERVTYRAVCSDETVVTERNAVANHDIGFDMTSLTNCDITAHLRACIDLAPFPDPRERIDKRSRVDTHL